MRGLVIFILVATASTSDARVKVSLERLGDPCPRGKTWGAVATCLAREGTLTTVRVLPRARLVHVVDRISAPEPLDKGYFLYVQHGDNSWSYGGFFLGYQATIRGFSRQTIDGHRGYRITYREKYTTTAKLDGANEVPVIVTKQEVVFCAGTADICESVTTHCDVIHRGKSVWSFRGNLVYERGAVRNVGDRSRGGAMCTTEEIISLGWPLPPE